MLHSKGRSCPHCNARLATEDTPQNTQTLSPAQRELLQYLDALDGPDRVEALKWMHDVVIYDSNEPLHDTEKNALYQVKVLWQLIEETLKE
ncbi:MAG: hypothetical protein AAF554_12380 [Bacteroidota bacterium]